MQRRGAGRGKVEMEGGGAGLGGRELPECREGGFDAHWSCMEKRFSAHTLFHKVLGLKKSQF